MPRSYQIILKNNFPTEEVFVNDNTVLAPQASDVTSGTTSYLIALASPKGVDGKVQTIKTQAEFLNKIGLGPFSLYGQPLLTAYSLAATGRAHLHLLRLMPTDAKYSTIHICAAYKVEENEPGEGEEPPTSKTDKLTVRFYAREGTAPTKLELLESAYTPEHEGEPNEEDGFTEVKLFSIGCLGKGKYGNAYQFRFDKLAQADRENNFKNYQFEIYENDGGVNLKEAFQVCFSEDALVGSTTYFVDSVINAPRNGSDYVTLVSYPEGFAEITKAYADVVKKWNAAHPDTQYTEFTIDDIDILLGSDKYNKQKAMPLYTIDTTSEGVINLSGSADGLPSFGLAGGDDGALDVSKKPEERQKALTDLYLKAYTGEIDPLIYSKNKFPTTILPDCNFDDKIKMALHSLGEKRTDCITLFDAGLNISTHTNLIPTVKDLCANFDSTYEAVDAYAGKVRDPYNQKLVTVTSTYALCLFYANLFYTQGGKHVPMADNDYGNLEDVFIQDTVFPVFDEDLHEEIMNDLIDERINFARVNALNEIHRATQTTRQPDKSVLSELNNAFVLKDVKRAMERLCARNRYNFAEAEDIERFNGDAERVCATFAGQVKSIKAEYGQTEYEANYNILHLYVELVYRNIVKSTIIEIDVNRG